MLDPETVGTDDTVITETSTCSAPLDVATRRIAPPGKSATDRRPNLGLAS